MRFSVAIATVLAFLLTTWACGAEAINGDVVRLKVETNSSAAFSRTAAILKNRLHLAGIPAQVDLEVSHILLIRTQQSISSRLQELLTARGRVMFRIVQSGAEFRSERPISKATYGMDPGGSPALFIKISEPAKFAAFTRANVGRDLEIYLDDRALTRVQIMQPILGVGEIVSHEPSVELHIIATIINAGPLPATVVQIRDQVPVKRSHVI